MDKNYNGFLGDEKECASVPYYVVESIIAVHKRQTIQLAIINLITVAVLIFGFAYIWTSYDYESSETTTVQADTLAHLKKNLLKCEKMEGEAEYSMMGYTARTMPTYYGNSYARRRDNMGRYSRNGYSRSEDMAGQLRDMMEDAPDEMTRTEIQRLVSKLENR